MMNKDSHLREVFYSNKYWILFTYLLLLVEFSLFAVFPYIEGKTIDSLLKNNYQWFYVFITTSILTAVVGTTRRRVDTRVFQKVWSKKSLETINRLKNRNISNSVILSRIRWISTYGDFFEYTMPTAIRCVIEIIVSTIMIVSFLNWMSSLIIVLAFVGLATSYLISFHVQTKKREYQETREQTDVDINNDIYSNLELSYDKMRKIQIRISDLEAFAWRWFECLHIVGSIITMMTIVKLHPTVGGILSAMIYTNKLFDNAMMMTTYFWHLKEIQMVDQMLEKN